jgi:DNA-directed RNA polymerase specialized sigma24 family protein
MRPINRPTEDQAIDLTARREAMRQNLARLNDDFERVLVLLLAIGFSRREIAQFEVGMGRQRVGQIIKRAVDKFQEV